MDAAKRFVSASLANDFGANVAAVARALVTLGQADVSLIVSHARMDRASVRRALLVLVKHDCVLVNEKVKVRSRSSGTMGAAGPAAVGGEEESSSSDDDDDVGSATELSKKKQAGASRAASRLARKRSRLSRPVYSVNFAVMEMRACTGWYANVVRRVLGNREADAIRMLASHGRLTPRDFCALVLEGHAARASERRERRKRKRQRTEKAEEAAAAAAAQSDKAEQEHAPAAAAAAPAHLDDDDDMGREDDSADESGDGGGGGGGSRTAEADAMERALQRLLDLRFVKRVNPLPFDWEEDAYRSGNADADGKRTRASDRQMLNEGNADAYLSIDYGRVLQELRAEAVVEYASARHGRLAAVIMRAMVSRHERDERRHAMPLLRATLIEALVMMSESELAEAALEHDEDLIIRRHAALVDRKPERVREARALAVRLEEMDEEDEREATEISQEVAEAHSERHQEQLLLQQQQQQQGGQQQQQRPQAREPRRMAYGLPGSPKLPKEGVFASAAMVSRTLNAVRLAAKDPIVARLMTEDGQCFRLLSREAVALCRDLYVNSSLVHQFGGIGAVRIYSVLRMHKKLEEKQVHDMATVEKKKGREMMYAMLQAGYLRVQEVPTTADRNPSKTIYLWMVQPGMVENTYVQQLCITWANLRERLDRERSLVQDLLRLESRDGMSERQTKRYEEWTRRRDRLSLAMGGTARLLVLFRHTAGESS